MGLGSAFARAFADLGHPAIRRVLWITLALTVGSFAGLLALVEFGLSTIEVADGGWIQELFGWLIGVLGGFATLALSWMLFPAVATFFAGFLLEDVAGQLEATHYPGGPKGHNPTVIGGAIAAAQFALTAVAVNLVALPVYVALLFVPPLSPLVFWAVNGYLLGREYFEVVALRHRGTQEVRDMRKQNSGRVFLAGCIVAVLFTVPVLNLVVPVIGVAAMVHLHRAMAAGRAGSA